MKGLFLKEIYCVRFQVLLGLAITSIPMFMMLFFLIDTPASAAQNPNEMLFAAIPVVLANLLCIMLNSSFMLNTLGDDNLSGWGKLQLTLPVSRKQIIDTKFIASLAIVGVLTLLSLILNIITALLNSLPLEICIASPLVSAAMEAIVLFPAFPISMKLSTTMTTVIYIVLEVAIMALVCVVIFAALEATLPVWLIRVLFYGIIPALGIVTLLISRHFAAKFINAEEI